MKKILSLIALSLILTSCASIKKAICDCNQDELDFPAETKGHAGSKAAKPKAETKNANGIVVKPEDLEAADRMTKAVDSYVFQGQPEEFTALCKGDKFDCFVDEKRFPKGKMKIKRKVPPFLSGSKMGLQGDKRVRVKYDFYP